MRGALPRGKPDCGSVLWFVSDVKNLTTTVLCKQFLTRKSVHFCFARIRPFLRRCAHAPLPRCTEITSLKVNIAIDHEHALLRVVQDGFGRPQKAGHACGLTGCTKH